MMIERNTTTLSNKRRTMNFSLTKRTIHPGVATLFSFFIVCRADGSQHYERIAQFDPAQNNFVPLLLDLGSRLYRAGAGASALLDKPSIDRLGLNALVQAVSFCNLVLNDLTNGRLILASRQTA